MLELKVGVGRATHHSERKVKCNGADYNLPIPLEVYRFVQITQEIVFQPDQELLISVLSGKKDSLTSFQQFYKLQDEGLKYFNLKVELNFDDLALKLLSDAEKILVDLDKCKFQDLLAVMRKAYDTYAKRLHSKFNRRIKKYLSISTRSQSEKQQIRKLVDLIKAESTDEEESPPSEKKEEPPKYNFPVPLVKKVENAPKKDKDTSAKAKASEKIKPQEKQAETQEKVEEKQEADEEQQSPEKPPKKEEKHSHFYEEIKKGKRSHPKKQDHKHEVDNEDDWEDVDEDEKVEQQVQIKNKKKQDRHKKEEADEDEWEEAKEQKFQKRKEKTDRRRHEKFDLQGKKGTPYDSNNGDNYDNNENNYTKKQRQSSKRNNDGKKFFQKSKEKPKKDLRVLLGLNGDTEDGWRERYRMERVPANIEKSEKPEKSKKKYIARDEQPIVQKQEDKSESKSPFQKPQKAQKSSNNLPIQKKEEEASAVPAQKVLILPTQQGTLQKVFSFPADGNQFKLDPSKFYRIRVNNNFWVILQKNLLTIEKDKTGYIRDGKFSSSDESLIEAQDLTISLTGMCNLEDGGTPFGNPEIKNFTGSDSQWFHLKELDVYTYK